eukprot:222007_1
MASAVGTYLGEDDDPVSDTGDSSPEWRYKTDATHDATISATKFPRLPLAPFLYDQDPLPRCGPDHEPPICYYQTDWYRFNRMRFGPDKKYDFLMNTHGKIRWFDQTGWKAVRTPEQRAKPEKGPARPYYGHQSMLTTKELKLIRDPEKSPIIYGGEFETDKDGIFRIFNGGSGHFRSIVKVKKDK